jgi:hypothetical protein
MTLSAPTAALTQLLTATAAQVDLSAAAPVLKTAVQSPPAEIVLSALGPVAAQNLTAAAAEILMSAPSPAVDHSRIVTVDQVASMDLAALPPGIVMSDTVEVTGAALITLNAGTAEIKSTLMATAGDMMFEAPAPAVATVLEPGAALITLEALGPEVRQVTEVTSATLTLSSPEPGVLPSVTIVPDAATITLDAAAPIIPGAGITIVAPSGTLLLEFPIPTLLGVDSPPDGNRAWFVMNRRRRYPKI